jgi:hypothetical protein
MRDDPMRPELRSLLREGSAKDGLSSAAADRMLANVLAGSGSAPIAKGSAAPKGVGLAGAKLVAFGALLFALGGAVGAGVALWQAPSRTVLVPTPMARLSPIDPGPQKTPSVAIEEAPTAAAASGQPLTPEDLPAAPNEAKGLRTSVSTDRKPFGVDPPDAAPAPAESALGERSVLDRGRVALARGDAARALSLVAEHESRFATGSLSEERDALRIRALASLGRANEAKDRAAVFRSRYPNSVFWKSIEGILSQDP